MSTITKIGIIISIACAALGLAKYSQEDKQLRQSEQVILQIETYLMEFSEFLQKITQLNRELGAVFCKSLKEKEPNLKQFDAKLNEIYIELRNEQSKLEEVLTNLNKSNHCVSWWLFKSQKKKFLLNQALINFYRQGLEVFSSQLTDTMKGFKKYRTFWPNLGAESWNNVTKMANGTTLNQKHHGEKNGKSA